MRKFDNQIDILKGLLIIFVIIGHSNWEFVDIIFWFHMPLFFMISGYLLHIPNKKDLMQWIKRKTKRYLIPYFCFFLLNYLLTGKKEIDSFTKSVGNIIFGGRMIGGVYWFITCLLLSLIMIVLIENLINRKGVKISVYIIMYLLAIMEAKFIIAQDTIFYPLYLSFPWNVDVCLLAIPYIVVGYYSKCYIEKGGILKQKLSSLLYLLSFIIPVILFLLYDTDIYKFHIDMKYGHYSNFILCMLIPICFWILLYKFAFMLNRVKGINKLLSVVGKASLEIMFLHQTIKSVVMIPMFGERFSLILWIIISCAIGVVFSVGVEQNKVLKMLFHGM